MHRAANAQAMYLVHQAASQPDASVRLLSRGEGGGAAGFAARGLLRPQRDGQLAGKCHNRFMTEHCGIVLPFHPP